MPTNRDLSPKKKPQRTCLGCRKTANKGDLIRIVRTPEGTVEIDRTGRMNGRGAYLCRDPQCLARVLKSGALSKSLKVPIPAETVERIAGEIGS